MSNFIVPIVFQLTNFRLVDYRAPEAQRLLVEAPPTRADDDGAVRHVAGAKFLAREGASDG
jgi:hypothetical protein